MENDRELIALISRYHQQVFAFAFYLLNDRDKAYEIAVSAFTEALGGPRLPAGGESAFVIRLYRITAAKCRAVKVIPRSDEELERLFRGKAGSLLVVERALQSLGFGEKRFLLLRDQARLPYAVIARITGTDAGAVKAETFRARGLLREKIARLLENGT